MAQTIAKYGMFRPGERVGVAVSAGPDSVALLRVLCALKDELGILPAVVHVNHRLRGADADADAEFTGALAASLGLDFVLESVDIRAEATRAGDNLEQVGRRWRYQFFEGLVRENRFQKIAVGHTRTDQAETVLFRFLRGATTAGLAGIYPVVEGSIVRPLLEVERPEVLAYLEYIGQDWREDATNRNLDFARNRLRHELLPQLQKAWNPAITTALAQLAEWARDEEAYWGTEIDRLASRYLRRQGNVILADASKLAALPAAAERRLLRHAVEQVRGDLRGIEFVHIERLRSLTAVKEGHGRAHVPGVEVLRSFDQVRLAATASRPALQARDFSLLLTIPGTYDFPELQTRIAFKLVERRAPDQGYNEIGHLDWERAPRPLWLRNWRPGDRYRPAGCAGEEKLKTLFQHRRVPLWERRQWPVVASEKSVVWARGFGPAVELAAGPHSRAILEITEVEKK